MENPTQSLFEKQTQIESLQKQLLDFLDKNFKKY